MDRSVLTALAEWLIPADRGLPAGVDDRHVDRALRVRPDLVPLVERAVAVCAGRPPEVAVPALAAADAPAYQALALLLSAAYFMHPKVRRQIGFTAHAPAPIYPDEAELDLEGGLIDPVTARGPLA